MVSSSLIRECLASGAMETANEMLGRLYSVTGEVVIGDGRGKQIGFPTANLSVWEDKLIPRNGIYAGWAWVGGRRYGAAINIGLRPTFGDDLFHPRVEPFILDFDRDIYGEEIRVDFVKFLRPEVRYDYIDQLITQIDPLMCKIRERCSPMPPERQVYLLDPRKYTPEVIAVAFAKTSRSPETFRQIADELTDEKSAQFHEKWVVGYGHSSVAEHAVLHIAAENISRLAVECLESNRLASYTEKSTRYQKWDPENFHIPEELKGHALLDDLPGYLPVALFNLCDGDGQGEPACGKG